MTKSYYQYLLEEGFSPLEKQCWAICGKSEGIQGWKLHLSSIQAEAMELLKKVLPVLKNFGTPFKVASNEGVLGQLNEGELGYSQVGKFVTIYPQSDDISINLAKVLVVLTKGMNGPIIPSDQKLGDVVYARYGSYNPVIKRDALGQINSFIYDGNGKLIPDTRHVPFTCPEGVINPFLDAIGGKPVVQDDSGSKLFGPGFLIIDMVKQNAKGSIFKAIDLRSQDQVGIKIIKQGRKFCLSDIHGRDIRDRLKRQEKLHFILQHQLNTPKASEYFEVNGDGYLPLEYIEGKTIETFVCDILKNRPWAFADVSDRRRILSCLLQLLCEVEKLHGAGFIHRDISASNVWITEAGDVYLLDLELASPIGNVEIPFGNGTPGFMSPNQQQRLTPQIGDDCFAIGSILLLSLTGLDPRRLIQLNTRKLDHKLARLTRGLSPKLIELICSCVDPDAKKRPTIKMITKQLSTFVQSTSNSKPVKSQNTQFRVFNNTALLQILAKGVAGTLHHTPRTNKLGLWLSQKINSNSSQQNFTELELRKGVHRGVVGVIYALNRIQKFTGIECHLNDLSQKLKWLIQEKDLIDSAMPGLYFGDAGIAVTIHEVMQNKMIERDEESLTFIKNSLLAENNWLDITHGIAGQGLAIIQCSTRGDSCNIDTRLSRIANHLISAQQPDGSWIVPPGVEGISGETVTGFAHGIAGIVYFLAEYGNRFNNAASLHSCDLGVRWMIENSISDHETMEWYYSDKNKVIWKWWCHGSPGIALTFLRLFEWTGEKRYAQYAKQALNLHSDHLVYSNLSQCHGLSGLGEIYLEAYRVLNEKCWLAKAHQLALTIHNLRFELTDQSYVWLVENAQQPTADLMAGNAGILHFYLRLWLHGNKIGFPMLMNPLFQYKTVIARQSPFEKRFL